MFAEYLRLLHSVYLKDCTLDCSLSICSQAGINLLTLPLLSLRHSSVPSAAFVYRGSGAYGWVEYFAGTIPLFVPDFSGGVHCTTVNYSEPAQLSGWVYVCVCERISCVYVRCKVNYTGKWIQHSLHVTRRQSTNFYRHRPAIWRPSTTVCLLRLGRCICVRVCGYTGGVCVWKSVCINFITTTQHSTAQYSTVKQFPSRTLPQHKILCEARLRLLSSSENLHVIRTEFLRVLRK